MVLYVTPVVVSMVVLAVHGAYPHPFYGPTRISISSGEVVLNFIGRVLYNVIYYMVKCIYQGRRKSLVLLQ